MTRFKVRQKVLAQIGNLEPWPAIIQSVVLNETQSGVYYHAKLLGSAKEIPVEACSLKPLKQNRFNHKMTTAELKKGAKEREAALFGPDDELPDFLWDLVTVESDYEELSDGEVSRLNLSDVQHVASKTHEEYENGPQEVQFDVRVPGSDEPLIRTLNNQLWTRQEFEVCMSLLSDRPKKPCEHDNPKEPDFCEDSGGPTLNIASSKSSRNSRPSDEDKCLIRFSCKTCSKKFKSRIALKHHVQNKKCPNSHISEMDRALIQQLRREKLKSIVHKTSAKKTPLNNKSPTKNIDKDVFDQIELDNKVKELIMSNTSKDVQQNLYTCNLCFRKFISEDMMLDHKQTHNSIRVVDSDVEIIEDNDDIEVLFHEPHQKNPKQSSGDDSSNDSRQLQHNQIERERRAELASRFQELAGVLFVENIPKAATLSLGKAEITQLEQKEKFLVKQITQLQDLNLRLNARVMQLKRM